MTRLDGEDLPNTMRYAPFVQDKRYKVTPTARGAVYQQSSEVLVQGDGILSWTMEALCFSELCDMYQLYKRSGALLFEGQYGERLMVEFISMKPAAQGGGNYSIAGQFLVRCVLADICESE